MKLTVKAPISELPALRGKELDVVSGNVVFGKAFGFRQEGGAVAADAKIDADLWRNYGSRGHVGGFPVAEAALKPDAE